MKDNFPRVYMAKRGVKTDINLQVQLRELRTPLLKNSQADEILSSHENGSVFVNTNIYRHAAYV